jgi:hypothetical protein
MRVDLSLTAKLEVPVNDTESALAKVRESILARSSRETALLSEGSICSTIIKSFHYNGKKTLKIPVVIGRGSNIL